MASGKRWAIAFEVEVTNTETDGMPATVILTRDDADLEGIANVVAYAASDLIRAWPDAHIMGTTVRMRCRTCGYEMPSGGISSCVCDSAKAST